MWFARHILLLSILFLFTPSVTVAATSRAPALLTDPVAPVLCETDTEALLTWRTYRSEHPTLVLLSNNPFLEPIPAAVVEDARHLVLTGTAEQVRNRSVYPSSNPLLLPGMGLSAALESGLFSQVVWILPLAEETPLPELAAFKKQLREHHVLNEKELASLKRSGDHIAGQVRNTPLRVFASHALPELSGPLIVHFDLSYFSARYRNEVKTPIYPMVGTELQNLRDKHWPVRQVTISQSNLLGNVPLGIRFLGPNLVSLLKKPEMLDKPLPKTWRMRAQALYLENFFKKEEMLELFQKMDKLVPDDPATKYSLYQVLRRFKNGTAALGHLAEAVRLDPIYALEYFSLAETAMKKKRPDAALEMLSLAQAAQPDSPWPSLSQLDILWQIGHDQPMSVILDRLDKLPWSEVYYPDIRKHLDNYRRKLNEKSE